MKAFAIADFDREPDEAAFERIGELVAAGVDAILIRDPRRPDRERWETARRCRELVGGGTLLWVHGRADLAVAVGADGVHLPGWGIPEAAVRRVAPGVRLGRSCHSVEECRRAAAAGAEHVFLGPVFAPRSKEGEGRVGREELTEAATLGPEVFALGGISMGNLRELAGLPIAGVAAITLFMEDRPVVTVVEAVRRI